MFEYIEGRVAQLAAGFVVIDINGLGYFVHISLNCYSALGQARSAKLFLHQIIREDAHTLYGFTELGERELFRLLIGVNGIGSSTAMAMLSALPHEDIRGAILSENIALLKSMKGIGPKTAQRVVIELKDKVGKMAGSETGNFAAVGADAEEAITALVMLGFQKKAVEKTIQALLKLQPNMKVEALVKEALKQL